MHEALLIHLTFGQQVEVDVGISQNLLLLHRSCLRSGRHWPIVVTIIWVEGPFCPFGSANGHRAHVIARLVVSCGSTLRLGQGGCSLRHWAHLIATLVVRRALLGLRGCWLGALRHWPNLVVAAFALETEARRWTWLRLRRSRPPSRFTYRGLATLAASSERWTRLRFGSGRLGRLRHRPQFVTALAVLSLRRTRLGLGCCAGFALGAIALCCALSNAIFAALATVRQLCVSITVLGRPLLGHEPPTRLPSPARA
mmetsp:Transcript_33434/g.73139  ORF Transcript_33434/g.73139 Transcript_33434/m.73139 type:complete len:255 (+) Transcript_33434:1771-2535(+)